MTWTRLLANKEVQKHRTSKNELDNIRALITRDLEDAAVKGCESRSAAMRRWARGQRPNTYGQVGIGRHCHTCLQEWGRLRKTDAPGSSYSSIARKPIMRADSKSCLSPETNTRPSGRFIAQVHC
jgi:hypothetical protein